MAPRPGERLDHRAHLSGPDERYLHPSLSASLTITTKSTPSTRVNCTAQTNPPFSHIRKARVFEATTVARYFSGLKNVFPKSVATRTDISPIPVPSRSG